MLVKNIKIDPASAETKLQQLIAGLTNVINTSLQKGDLLPSINTLSKELSLSRDTVFKAYLELKKRGIVDSTPAKSYYVCSNHDKVLLFLDFYSPFKDLIYRELEYSLGENYTIDLIFHHYNFSLFEKIILESAGKYSSYLIMNFDTQTFQICEILKKIDPSKLIMLDIPIENWGDFEQEKYNYIWQDFYSAVNEALESIKDRILKFDNFQLVYPGKLKHPEITFKAFHNFCKKYSIETSVSEQSENLNIKKGDAFFIFRQDELTEILKQCREKNLECGSDIGILAYNDYPLYEFVSGGITVISADFKLMGMKAAQFIKERIPVHETVPTKLILRNSI